MREKEIHYYWPDRFFDPYEMGRDLAELIRIQQRKSGKRDILFLCIGSDRATGDCLGPLVGYQLKQMHQSDSTLQKYPVFGDLERPVHAGNLEYITEKIKIHYPEHLMIAIDASVGRPEQVGQISMGLGGLCPGLGVCKDLARVGDLFITGVVSCSSPGSSLFLYSVRLGHVYVQAERICRGIREAQQELERRNELGPRSDLERRNELGPRSDLERRNKRGPRSELERRKERSPVLSDSGKGL